MREDISKEINKLELMKKCHEIVDKLGRGEILHKESDGCGGGNLEYSNDKLSIHEVIGYFQDVASLEIKLLENEKVVFKAEVIDNKTPYGYLPIINFKNERYNVVKYSSGEWINLLNELYVRTKGKKSNINHSYQKYHEIRPGIKVCFDS